MFYISDVYTSEPKEKKNKVQDIVYKVLSELEINYERVETDEVITMEDCIEINKKFDSKKFSSLIDNNNRVKIILDKDVLNEDYYGCSYGTTTSYMKIKTSDIINKVLPYSKHKKIIDL